jgi:hypothetical protein
MDWVCFRGLWCNGMGIKAYGLVVFGFNLAGWIAARDIRFQAGNEFTVAAVLIIPGFQCCNVDVDDGPGCSASGPEKRFASRSSSRLENVRDHDGQSSGHDSGNSPSRPDGISGASACADLIKTSLLHTIDKKHGALGYMVYIHPSTPSPKRFGLQSSLTRRLLFWVRRSFCAHDPV